MGVPFEAIGAAESPREANATTRRSNQYERASGELLARYDGHDRPNVPVAGAKPRFSAPDRGDAFASTPALERFVLDGFWAEDGAKGCGSWKICSFQVHGLSEPARLRPRDRC